MPAQLEHAALPANCKCNLALQQLLAHPHARTSSWEDTVHESFTSRPRPIHGCSACGRHAWLVVPFNVHLHVLIWMSMPQGQAGGQSTAAHLLSNLAAWPAMQSALLARQGLVVLLAGIIGGKQAVLDARIPAAAARLVANLAHTDAGAHHLYDEVSARLLTFSTIRQSSRGSFELALLYL